MTSRHLGTLLPLLLMAAFAAHAAGPASTTDKTPPRIKKCQDAKGNWHYGDKADELCSGSKIMELDKQGVQRKVIAVPKTGAELKAMEDAKLAEEQAKKAAEEQAKRDSQLLAAYTHEEDITSTRDRRISEVDAQIKATEDTVKSLRVSLGRLHAQAAEEQRAGRGVPAVTTKAIANNEAQIVKHERNVEKWRKDQETMRTQYQADIVRFREAKNRQAMTLSPLPAANTPSKK